MMPQLADFKNIFTHLIQNILILIDLFTKLRLFIYLVLLYVPQEKVFHLNMLYHRDIMHGN